MLKIEIPSIETRNLSGTSEKTNKPYSFKLQDAYVWPVDSETGQQKRYPEKIELTLDADQEPYGVGNYALDVSSVYVNRNGRLQVNPVLKPYRQAATAPSTAKTA